MYKVNIRRQENGTYHLAFGKGKGKLTAVVQRDGKDFVIDNRGIRGKLQAVKAAWGAWATTVYGIESLEVQAPHANAKPSGESLVIPDELQGSVYTTRQWEIDHAKTKQEAWEWYHHVNRIESAHIRRDPNYNPHKYNRPSGPLMRDPVLVAKEVQ